jgi:major vault protein
VRLDVRVSYQVTFEREHKQRWFNHEDYVGVLCDHLRSLVRGRARQVALIDLWPNLPTVIRDTILGERTEAGRAGRLFEENGMHVTEVEVLSSEILDDEIAQLLEGVQRESVSLVINDRQAGEQLRSEKLRHEIGRERMEMQRAEAERKAGLDEVVRKLAAEARLAKLRADEAASREAAQLGAERAELELRSVLERNKLTTAAEIAGQRESATARVELDLVRARSAATVAERQAVQPALVEALTALGDKVVLGEVAENMNLVSLFKGKDVASIFRDVVGGTKLGRTIEKMLPAGGNGEGTPAGEEKR